MKKPLWVAGLAIAAVLGNYFYIPLFFGVDFLFGGIAALVAVALFGPWIGGLVAAIGSAYTILLWGHPYAALVWTFEAIAVGLLLSRVRSSLLIAICVYWSLVGIPAVAFSYHIFMDVPAVGAVMAAFKQAINAVMNALIASVLLMLVPIIRLRKHKKLSWPLVSGDVGLQDFLFILTMASVLVPVLVSMVSDSRRQREQIEADIEDAILQTSETIADRIETWREGRMRTVEALALVAERSGRGASPSLQQIVQTLQESDLGFADIHVVTNEGRAVAFYPSNNQRGESLIGFDFSQREFFQEIKNNPVPTVTDIFAGQGGQATVIFAVPIMFEGKFSGYAGGALRIGTLRERLLSGFDEDNVNITLLDKSGRVISSAISTIKSSSSDPADAVDDVRVLDREIYHRIEQDLGRPIMVRWQESWFGKETTLPNLGWTLIVETPVLPFQQKLQRRYMQDFIFTYSIVLTVLLASYMLSRWLSAPLKFLAGQTAGLALRLAQGELSPLLRPVGVLEIDQLQTNFDAMGKALQTSFGSIAAQHELIKTITDNTAACLFMLDLDGRCTFMNKAAADVTGYDFDDIEGKSLHYVLHHSHPDGSLFPAEDCPLDRALSERRQLLSYETSFVRKNGELFPVVCWASPMVQDGKPLGTVVEVRDITEEKEAEEALRQSEKRFRALADAMPQIVWTATPNGKVDYFNRRWYEYMGDDSSGLRQAEAVHPEDLCRWLEAWDKSVKTGDPLHVEIRVRERSSGELRWFLTRAVPIRDEKGRIGRWYGTSTDIDYQKRREQQLQFLSDASQVVSSSLDYNHSLSLVARLAVPDIADWCAIRLLEGEGMLRLITAAHTDPSKSELIATLDREYSMIADWHQGAYHVFKNARSELVQNIPDDVLVHNARDDRHLKIMRQVGFTSLMVVPIMNREECLGTISFVSSESGRRFTEADLAFAEDLGRRIGVAIDNARLFHQANEEKQATQALYEIGRLLAAELDVQKLMQAVTDWSTRTTSAQFGAFFYNVAEEGTEGYSLYTISGVPREAFSKFPMPRNTAVFAPTFRGEGVVRLDDVTKDPRFGHNAPYFGMPKGHLPVHSYLAVPVISRSGTVLGAMFFGHHEVGVFSERAEKMAVSIATQAAIAIDNANLFKKSQDELERRRQAEEALRHLNEDLEERVKERTAQMQAVNKELEAFSYAVSHDLRSPLRGIDGFSDVLMRNYGDRLDDQGRDYLARVRAGAQRMSRLIDDMLMLSRLSRREIRTEPVDLSQLAQSISDELASREPARRVVINIQAGLVHEADVSLLRSVLENLLGNAWKFTQKQDVAHIDFGMSEIAGERVFYVKDDGAGFDMAYSHKLFGAFQRLHRESDFPGTGIGLATVQRIIRRHGGRVWAEGAEGEGAAFYFTLGKPEVLPPHVM